MRKIVAFLVLWLTVSVFGQTSLHVYDYNTSDGCVELFYSNPNVDVVAYRISWNKDGTSAWSNIKSSTTYSVICGLDDGVYTFRVQALDASDASIDPPAEVTGIEIVNPSIPVAPFPNIKLNKDYSVTITWQKSVGADHYKLEWAQDQYFFYTEVHSKILAPDQTSYTLTDLPNGTWYFRMFAYASDGTESELYYTPPSVVVDKPVKSESWLPWFTENEYWESNLYIKLPNNVYTADVEIMVRTLDGITLSKTVNINSSNSQKGYAYQYNVSELFGGLVQMGAVKVFSPTIGLTASMEIIAKKLGVADTYPGVDVRQLKSVYVFPGVTIDRDYIEGVQHILAYVIQTDYDSRFAITIKLSYVTENDCYDVGSRSILMDVDGVKAGILNNEFYIPVGYTGGYWIATVTIEDINGYPFYCLLSQQAKLTDSDAMFATWVAPANIE